MRKVLFIQKSLKLGGAQKFSFLIQKLLSQSNVQVEVLILGPNKAQDYYQKKIEEMDLPIALTFLPEPSYPSYFFKLLKRFKIVKSYRKNRFLKKIQKRIDNSDVISFHDIYLFKELSSFLTNKKVIMHELCHLFQFNQDPYKNFNFFPPKTKITFVEDSQKIMFSKINKENLIHLPIILDDMKQERLTTHQSSEHRIAVVSRMHPNKSPTIFINFFKILTGLFAENVILYFIGGYDEKTLAGSISFAYIKRVVEVLGIKNRIIFLGEQQDIKACLRDHHIDVVWGTSINEFIGYSSIESINFGIPCVFWDCDGTYDKDEESINRHQNSVDFVNFTVSLLKDFSLRQRELSKQQSYIKEKNDVNSMKDQILSLYK